MSFIKVSILGHYVKGLVSLLFDIIYTIIGEIPNLSTNDVSI
jgi:hypothetical protein